ncbi:hypothetical protein [Deinococcus cellulosilyticus]|uniref:Uncharacterized protein n=1 Tax=Deinococcus cellulosilyticus (strain DSM 18568 / NBRC 106333 / KACC 11606 / 5516J-15) TaxID=1223518 RepID=A0A511N2Z3_DEIC1|nr:hypothetical protein [Deinococcus cellulosilyticus]GEM47219.1 hypothetical protein DC3_28540 [Deinococcus cellulosilyticus NBRC 106333 = KACC 11606]
MIQTLTLETWAAGWTGLISLPAPDSISVDQSGNITWTISDPTEDVRAAVSAFLSRNVNQQRTRAGTYVCIADPTPQLVRATWQEVVQLGADQNTVTATGALVMPSYTVARTREDITLVLYICGTVITRGSGVVIP